MSTTHDLRRDPLAERLHLIMQIRDITNAQLGARVGMGTNSVQKRRNATADGKGTPIRGLELYRFAEALNVPPSLFTAGLGEVFAYFADEYAARDSNPEPTDSGSRQLSLLEDVILEFRARPSIASSPLGVFAATG